MNIKSQLDTIDAIKHACEKKQPKHPSFCDQNAAYGASPQQVH